ncbi:MAG: hypothetical protein SF187_16730 [Deltaproteobacteria bacterium]|nr:hypothetical protein [Deltaproteobacteria bacterium]
MTVAACEGDVHKDIHGNIHVVVNRDDAFVPPAAAALVNHGLRALPQIETALHSAKPDGRLRLVEVMSRIKHPDTVHLLRHLALFDADARVRALSETTLSAWSQQNAPMGLASAAQSAAKWLQQRRAQADGTPLDHLSPSGR